MRRAAAVMAALLGGIALLLMSRGSGAIARAPQITFGGLTGALFSYDVAIDLAAPIVHGIEQLPVAWSWSSDGSRLAYVLLDSLSGAYDILLWTPALRRATPIAQDLPYGSPPQWSPDNQFIAAVDSHQDICLYALAADTSRCLGVQPAGQPTWSPDGSAIAYLSRLPAGGLLRVDLADSLVSPLFTGVNGINHPRWSPEGSLIAFSYQTGSSDLRHLYVVPSGGGAVRAVTGGETWQDQPVWSPDGSALAYNEHPTTSFAQPDVAIVNVESGTIINVTTHPLVDTDPRWSPDGRYLAFVSDRFDGKPRLHIVATATLTAAEPLAVPGVLMRLYAYAWRP